MSIAAILDDARRAQQQWRAVPLPQRLRAIGRLRALIAECADELVASVELPARTSDAETLSAELIPLADGCRFLQRRAGGILAPRRLGAWGRPVWLWGTRSTVHRVPLGVVLIIAPWNYPLLLGGAQAIQALAAGNAVLLKPGRASFRPTETLARLIHRAGIDPRLCVVLDETVETAEAAIRAGVDQVILTGSAATGRAVLAGLADSLTPAVMELSGCDAVLVRADADPTLAARLIQFGLRLNSGATCISPRRIIVHRAIRPELERALAQPLDDAPPLHPDPAAEQAARGPIEAALRDGARVIAGRFDADRIEWPLVLTDASPEMDLLQADVFVPVTSVVEVADDDEAIRATGACPYGLGASVIGRDTRAATRIAEQLPAGSVAVGDLIVPTVDPRVPFGGCGRSGFGSTRGAEGLLAMTRPQVVSVRAGGWLPHLDALRADNTPRLAALLRAYLAMAHGRTLAGRLRGLRDALRAAIGLSNSRRNTPPPAPGKEP